MNTNQKTTGLTDEQRKIIESACMLTGISYSSFLKSCALKEARKILIELDKTQINSN